MKSILMKIAVRHRLDSILLPRRRWPLMKLDVVNGALDCRGNVDVEERSVQALYDRDLEVLRRSAIGVRLLQLLVDVVRAGAAFGMVDAVNITTTVLDIRCPLAEKLLVRSLFRCCSCAR